MALPVWALYMQRVYDDFSLRISKRDFDYPSKPISVDLDCGDEETPGHLTGKKKKHTIDTDEF